MKVLQITTNYPTESNPILGIFMKEQIESVERFGVENVLFFSNGTEHKVGKKGGGAIVHFKSIFKLAAHLLVHKYDIIHCHGALSGAILLLSGGAFFNRCIVSFQNDPEQDGDKQFFRKLYPFFRKIIVKTKGPYLDKSKVIYLPNGCNMSFFHPMDKDECKRQLGLATDKRYVLFVDSNTSRKRTQKRKDRFDEVMKILRDEYCYSDIEELVMIGIPRVYVPAYMNACDLHLMTSDQEGSPNSVKECMCCNVPVVSTNVGNVHDLLDGVRGCYVSDSFDAHDLAVLADRVLSCNERHDMRSAIVHKKLDMDSVAERLYGIYFSMISEK